MSEKPENLTTFYQGWETYQDLLIKAIAPLSAEQVKKVWMYLYRAVDSDGNTLEFLLSPTRDAEAAKRFFAHCCSLRVFATQP